MPIALMLGCIWCGIVFILLLEPPQGTVLRRATQRRSEDIKLNRMLLRSMWAAMLLMYMAMFEGAVVGIGCVVGLDI